MPWDVPGIPWCLAPEFTPSWTYRTKARAGKGMLLKGMCQWYTTLGMCQWYTTLGMGLPEEEYCSSFIGQSVHKACSPRA